ncbi:MAG: MIF4G domain-containing protein [archaeon]|nr:MIF4G domain-containing protein [archaeon]
MYTTTRKPYGFIPKPKPPCKQIGYLPFPYGKYVSPSKNRSPLRFNVSPSKSALTAFSPSRTNYKNNYPKTNYDLRQNQRVYSKKRPSNGYIRRIPSRSPFKAVEISNIDNTDNLSVKTQEINICYKSTVDPANIKINPINLEKAAYKLNNIFIQGGNKNKDHNSSNRSVSDKNREEFEKIKKVWDLERTQQFEFEGKPGEDGLSYFKRGGKDIMVNKLERLELLMNKLGMDTKQIPKDIQPLEILKDINNNPNQISTTSLPTMMTLTIEDNKKKKKKEEKKEKIKYSLETILSFQNKEICLKDDRLNRDILRHLVNYNKIERIGTISKGNGKDNRNNSKGKDFGKKEKEEIILRKNSRDSPLYDNTFKKESLEKWSRMDVSKETNKAINNVVEIKSNLDHDSVRFDITSILNTLTVDNYESVKQKLYEILIQAEINQLKFIEVLLKKAINEKYYVSLYSKLCNEINELIAKKTGNDKTLLRSKLIEKTSQIFSRFVNKENFDDPDYEFKIKKYLIGNVNLIGELIKVKILPLKAGFTCLEDLIEKYKEDTIPKSKLLHFEAFLVMLDNFGKTVFLKGKRNYIEHIDFYIDEVLPKIMKDNKLPGFLKYRAINLTDKRNKNWEDTLYEKFSVAKGKGGAMMKEIKTQNISDNTAKTTIKDLDDSSVEDNNVDQLSEGLSSDEEEEQIKG